MVFFRHERIRPSQKELMDDIYDAICKGENFMAQAPTGLGKTDAALSAAITAAAENNLNVFFLTPKISQHRIAMEVANGIAKKHGLPLRSVDIVGRSHCCIEPALSKLDGDSFHTSCSKKIRNQQCIYYSNSKGHSRMQEAVANRNFKVLLNSFGSGKTHDELISLGKKASCCPYEWLIKLAECSNVVIADYHHLMMPSVRDIFLMKIKKRIDDSIIIIDEAHNLAQRVRSSLSRSISNLTFLRVHKEMQYISLDAGPLEQEFLKWAKELLDDRSEMTIAAFEFDFFIQKFGITMDEAIERLGDAGLQYVEKTNKKSACLSLAKFMAEWKNDHYECVRILKKKGDDFFLSKRLLDPAPATRVLNQCHSSILMSGTLLPLEMHRDILGLDKERTKMKEYSSPFNPENVVNIITDNHTTKFTKRNRESFMAMGKSIDSIIGKTPGGVALFFPSYGVMDSVIPHISSQVHRQEPGMKPADIRQMIAKFSKGGVLCGVQGGSLSEGVDFSKGEIKTTIIVGVALEEMDVETRALIDYYEEKFGRGWDYGYIFPGTIKALQAAGRGRRKEEDRVAIVYMDERFRWNKYNWILNKEEPIVVTDKPELVVEQFWGDDYALY